MAIVVKFEIMDNYLGLTLSRQKLNKRRLIANIDCELIAESQNLQKKTMHYFLKRKILDLIFVVPIYK